MATGRFVAYLWVSTQRQRARPGGAAQGDCRLPELEFGHFGLAGSPLGVDPERRLGGDVVQRVAERHGGDAKGT